MRGTKKKRQITMVYMVPQSLYRPVALAAEEACSDVYLEVSRITSNALLPSLHALDIHSCEMDGCACMTRNQRPPVMHNEGYVRRMHKDDTAK
jgi:hypothetical protein